MKMNRVFLKLSGEALAGPKKTGFDEATLRENASHVRLYCKRGSKTGKIICRRRRSGRYCDRRRKLLERPYQRCH